MTNLTTLLVIKQGTAAKTSPHADGAIRYCLLTDEDRSDVFIAIVGNDGGSGYFSKEAVPFTKIEQCVGDFNADKPLQAKTFKDAFIGRSVNNPGFLCAVLRAELLLIAAPNTTHLHRLAGDWTEWKRARLSEPAQPQTPQPAMNDANNPPTGAEITSTEDHEAPDQPKSVKHQKKGAGKHSHPNTKEPPNAEGMPSQ